MSYIMGPDVVKYACTCGLLKPISLLYFCRYCLQLRCGFCVCHEVDSIFCGKCLENIPSSEARLKKNRCSNCLVCPSCQQDVSTRIGSKVTGNAEGVKATPSKVYYLSCFYCRWSSRDVGLPDQTAATGGWPERDNVHAHRIQEIIEHAKSIVVAERLQKELNLRKKKEKYVTYTDLTGVTASMLRKRLGLPAEVSKPSHKWVPKPAPPPAVPTDTIEELPEDIFTKPVNLMEVTTIEQRLQQPEVQPVSVDLLFPVHKQMTVKRSLRCRTCEHNVSKPEYSPNSVKFKIQLFAYYHVPEIRIVTVEPLRAGRPAELILKFTNPTQHQTVISFQNVDVQIAVPEEIVERSAEDASQPSSLLSFSTRQPSITIKPRDLAQDVNAEMNVPSSSVILPPRDDAAEYDDSGDTHNIEDDPKLVIRRKSNKAFVKLVVTPRADLELNTDVITGFTIRHLYTNTTIASTIKNKNPDKRDHSFKVFLTLGKLVGNN